MKLEPAGLPGLFVLQHDRSDDDRGSFHRVFDAEVLEAAGLVAHLPQHSISRNGRAGTLRGIHLQRPPAEEVKILRCSRGRIFDVVVDLRPGAGHGRWESFELHVDDGRSLYVPAGFGHGFQTLDDDAEISYLISAPHRPDLADGVRYDDPRLGIPWPLPVSVISPRDLALPLLA